MAKQSSNHFDYLIVGNGLAGLQLALALERDPFFTNKSVALIDKDLKVSNDKTWCFWEEGKGKWDFLVSKSWRKGKFLSPTTDIHLDFSTYNYKMIRSIDFYGYAKDKLEKSGTFKLINQEVLDVQETPNHLKIGTNEAGYTADLVFDSRIPKEYFEDNRATKIQQHFKGYLINTQADFFSPEEFTMMDYRLRYNGKTSFTYILPISKSTALIEYTFFTPELVEEKIYDEHLKRYISEYLHIDDYEIVEIEKGIIPMTDYDFDKFNTEKITKIGTGGGWVKGSTGYSFKHTEKKVATILRNLKIGKRPSTGLFKKRFKFYDSIFLNVLKDHNEDGMQIFEKFYSKNNEQEILAFLDETSTIPQEIKILNSLFSKTFISVFFKRIFST